MVDVAAVERALADVFVAAEGTSLRREDRKKSREVAALLGELARLPRDGLLVDAAAGKSYVGLLAAELLGFSRVVTIEREPARVASCRGAAARLSAPARRAVEVREGDVGDPAAWPEAPRAVVALHACGAASDGVIDAAVRARARWLFLVPCCYGADVRDAARAARAASELGVPRHAEVRRRFVTAVVDAARTLRLEAAGYEATVVPLVAPTVTPHNLLWRARWIGESARARAAAEQLAKLDGCAREG